jgi:elongation factor P--beta-lysine ligase
MCLEAWYGSNRKFSMSQLVGDFKLHVVVLGKYKRMSENCGNTHMPEITVMERERRQESKEVSFA